MIVTVIFHQEAGSWWAESPDIPGASASAESLHVCRSLFRGIVQLERTFVDYREVIMSEGEDGPVSS